VSADAIANCGATRRRVVEAMLTFDLFRCARGFRQTRDARLPLRQQSDIRPARPHSEACEGQWVSSVVRVSFPMDTWTL